MAFNQKVDYILSGQGLAGSCLALQLIRRNKRILVFDIPEENHASTVAAGLFNPFTGKIMARTWMADQLFPYLFSFYREAGEMLGQNFFFPRNLYRPFISIEEQNSWMGKSAGPPFAQYIDSIFLEPSVRHVHDPFGGLLLNSSGHVDVPAFMRAIRTMLVTSGSYRHERLDPGLLEVADNGVTYGALRAGAVVFCEGMGVTQNPFFSWLPINPLKGETIRVQMESPDYIVNRGVYVVPSAQAGEFNVGATYDFTSHSPGITNGGREELETRLKELLRTPYRVRGQNWGVRPTTLDQKLMIGAHPLFRNLLIFNGLGTKGVSQAPYFSAQMAAWMAGEEEIIPEVNIQRYKALYSKSQ